MSEESEESEVSEVSEVSGESEVNRQMGLTSQSYQSIAIGALFPLRKAK